MGPGQKRKVWGQRSTHQESRPSRLSPRMGNISFFTRGDVNPDWRDTFWVNAKIIEELRPKGIKQ